MSHKIEIKALTYTVSDGLREYIAVHNKFYKEYATIKSFFKSFFGLNTPSTELLFKVEELIKLWDNIFKKVSVFIESSKNNISEEENRYIQTLLSYVLALNKTVYSLSELIKFLMKREYSFNSTYIIWNTIFKKSIGWQAYKEKQVIYDNAIKNYITIGGQLNKMKHIIFYK